MSELLPCPICGNHAFLSITGNAGARSIWCVTDGCLRLAPRASEAEAIAAWNRRTPAAPSEGLEAKAREMLRVELTGITLDELQKRADDAGRLYASALRAITAALSSRDEIVRECAAVAKKRCFLPNSMQCDNVGFMDPETGASECSFEMRGDVCPCQERVTVAEEIRDEILALIQEGAK